jgi:hypothetical protein
VLCNVQRLFTVGVAAWHEQTKKHGCTRPGSGLGSRTPLLGWRATQVSQTSCTRRLERQSDRHCPDPMPSSCMKLAQLAKESDLPCSTPWQHCHPSRILRGSRPPRGDLHQRTWAGGWMSQQTKRCEAHFGTKQTETACNNVNMIERDDRSTTHQRVRQRW